MRVIYGLGILFVLFIAFQSYGWLLIQNGGSNIRLMAAFAEQMFHSVSTLQYIALFAFVPMFLCGAVAGEREEQTLELLFTTALKDREIILGKMLSRLVIFGLLILMALPIFGLISFFGGISPPALFRVAGAMLTALLFAGAHAIYFSTVTKSPMGALRTYWRMAVWLLIVPIVGIFVMEMLSFNGSAAREFAPYFLTFLCCTNPIAAFVIAIAPELYESAAAQAGRFGWGLSDWFFPLIMLIPWIWSGFLIYRATRRLRLMPTVAQAFILKLLPIRKAYRAVTNALTAPYRCLRSPRELFLWFVPVRNPLWLRARQSYCFDREGHLRRLQVWSWVVAGVFLLLISISGYAWGQDPLSHPDSVIAFLPVTWTAIAIFCTIVAGVSVVGDRRRGFFDLLLTTPLSNHQIVDGTFLSVWVHLAIIAVLPLALLVLFLLTGAGAIYTSAISLAIASAFLVALTFQGIACSLCARNLAGALVPTCIFIFITTMGIAFLVAAFERYAPAVLCFLCLAGLFISSFWVRNRVTAASVGCYFLFVFECLVTGATAWVGWDDTHFRGIMVAAAMPSVQAFSILSPHSTPFDGVHAAVWIQPCHLLALLVFCIWARWWLAVHFEALVGRAANLERRPGSLAGATATIVRFFYWHIPEALRPRCAGRRSPCRRRSRRC